MQAGQNLPQCELRSWLDKQARKVIDLKELKGEFIYWNAHEFYAVEMIQRCFRGFRTREKLHTRRQHRIKASRFRAAFNVASSLLLSLIHI